MANLFNYNFLNFSDIISTILDIKSEILGLRLTLLLTVIKSARNLKIKIKY